MTIDEKRVRLWGAQPAEATLSQVAEWVADAEALLSDAPWETLPDGRSRRATLRTLLAIVRPALARAERGTGDDGIETVLSLAGRQWFARLQRDVERAERALLAGGADGRSKPQTPKRRPWKRS